MSSFPYDSVRNAREAGFENVPEYLVTDSTVAGSTDRPALDKLSNAGQFKRFLARNPWVWIAAGLALLWWMRKR